MAGRPPPMVLVVPLVVLDAATTSRGEMINAMTIKTDAQTELLRPIAPLAVALVLAAVGAIVGVASLLLVLVLLDMVLVLLDGVVPLVALDAATTSSCDATNATVRMVSMVASTVLDQSLNSALWMQAKAR